MLVRASGLESIVFAFQGWEGRFSRIVGILADKVAFTAY